MSVMQSRATSSKSSQGCLLVGIFYSRILHFAEINTGEAALNFPVVISSVNVADKRHVQRSCANAARLQQHRTLRRPGRQQGEGPGRRVLLLLLLLVNNIIKLSVNWQQSQSASLLPIIK